jgi:ATP/maltotriose-dependent transcriptional regulator MalT
VTLPEAGAVVEEARALAKCSGDVLARFSIESNLAAAFLDAGDVERADVLMAEAEALSGVGEMDINRFIQANNRAELALSRCDYPAAAHAFASAASYLGPTTPTYMQDLVNAGLGYCALETGDLAEARRREQRLPAPPRSWYFDPTTIVAFRARLLERRGKHGDAVQVLADAGDQLKGRLVLAWLKIALLQVRLMAKQDRREAKELAERTGREARSLRLEYRAREFEALVKRVG